MVTAKAPKETEGNSSISCLSFQNAFSLYQTEEFAYNLQVFGKVLVDRTELKSPSAIYISVQNYLAFENYFLLVLTKKKIVEILISFPINSDKKARHDNKSWITLPRHRKDIIHNISVISIYQACAGVCVRQEIYGRQVSSACYKGICRRLRVKQFVISVKQKNRMFCIHWDSYLPLLIT